VVLCDSNGGEYIAAEEEWQSPVEGVGVRSAQVVEGKIVRPEQRVGVGHAEVDGCARPICPLLGGGKILS